MNFKPTVKINSYAYKYYVLWLCPSVQNNNFCQVNTTCKYITFMYCLTQVNDCFTCDICHGSDTEVKHIF